MSILQQIVTQKRLEIEAAQKVRSIEALQDMPLFYRPTISISQRIKEEGSSGVIAEFKRHSPSKKWINQTVDPVEVVTAYQNAGVAASSVLTDEQFFKGSLEDLVRVRAAVDIPLLRKDFMIDPYQMYEAKAYGADVVLLIASILTPCEASSLTDVAHQLGLEVLLELHGESELGHVNSEVELVGINNRNLNTFEVDVEQSARMAQKLDPKIIKVAESGISSPDMVKYFRSVGFEAFLIGENFMKTADPGQACKDFVQAIK